MKINDDRWKMILLLLICLLSISVYILFARFKISSYMEMGMSFWKALFLSLF